MARRKRIAFQQTGRGGRRGGVPESFDRLFITRRMLVAKAAVVAGFATLAGRLGYMQIVAHDAAVEDARGNTEFTKSLTAPRGLIYDRQGRLLAKNETAFQVEIVPRDLPDATTAAADRRRVLDQLIAELQIPDALVIDPNRIPGDQKDEVYTMIAQRRGREGEDIAASVKAIRKAEDQNYLILLEDDLSIDDAAKWREASRSMPGLMVTSLLDYQLGNTSATSRNPIVVATVGREVAMRVEANRLYLPGVRIDDSVLVRRYPAGQSMSHLLGYVGPVSEEEIAGNKTDAGNPIYANNDTIGKDGLEFALEETLRGRKGYQRTLRDAIGNEVGIAPGSEDFNQPATPGDSVTLTIDLELQAAASLALKSFIIYSTEDRKAKGNDKDKQFSNSGAVVAMDPRNGEVLALVSYPQFDNELLAQGISQALWTELTDPDGSKPYFNRAIGSAQPPGSTFKAFLAAAALYEDTLQPESTFVCTGGIGIPIGDDLINKRFYPCWNAEGHEAVNLEEALRTSCDVYFYNVGTGTVEDLLYYDSEPGTGTSGEPDYGTEGKEFSGLGIDRIHKDLTEKFWFSQTTDFILGGESTGLIPSQEWLFDNFAGQGWSAGDTIITSIGQGSTQVTPLQMATNTVAIANGGTVHKPVVVRNTIRSQAIRDGTPETAQKPKVVPMEPESPLRVIDFNEGNLEAVRRGMLSVTEGFVEPFSKLNSSVSYAALNVNDVQVQDPEFAWPRTNPPGTMEEDRIHLAGKTGTAEVEPSRADLPAKDPETGRYINQHAWFTCWAPYDEPEIVVSVLIEYGGEGGSYAAPCADTVLRAYFETTGKRSRNQTIEYDGEQRTVSVLREDKEPIRNIETASLLNFWKPGELYNTGPRRQD